MFSEFKRELNCVCSDSLFHSFCLLFFLFLKINTPVLKVKTHFVMNRFCWIAELFYQDLFETFQVAWKHRGKVKQPAGLWTEVNKLYKEKSEVSHFSPVLSSSWLLLLMYYPSFVLADGQGAPCLFRHSTVLRQLFLELGSLTMDPQKLLYFSEFQFSVSNV